MVRSSTVARTSPKIFRSAGDCVRCMSVRLTLGKFPVLQLVHEMGAIAGGAFVILGKSIDGLCLVSEYGHATFRLDCVNHGQNQLGTNADDVLGFVDNEMVAA